VFSTLFGDQGIEEVLKEEFSREEGGKRIDYRLKAANPPVLVTSYDMEAKAPWIFRSEAAKLKADEDFPLWQVARATSAAPTYFPPFLLKSPKKDKQERMAALAEPDRDDQHSGNLALLDGGMFANNPSVLAYTEMLAISQDWKLKNEKPSVLGNPRGFDAPAVEGGASPDFLLLSLGCGQTSTPYPYRKFRKSWGPTGAIKLIEIFMQGTSATVDYQMQCLLPRKITASGNRQRYFRLNPTIPQAASEMSDISEKNLFRLKKAANDMLEQPQVKSDLQQIVCRLQERKV
ncbi:MAG: patatin-like phospholipase family protein, partial [Bacteroidota bacterium]